MHGEIQRLYHFVQYCQNVELQWPGVKLGEWHCLKEGHRQAQESHASTHQVTTLGLKGTAIGTEGQRFVQKQENSEQG